MDEIWGQSEFPELADAVVSKLRSSVGEGIVWIGYPIIGTYEERIKIELLLVSPSTGIAAFSLASDSPTADNHQAWDSLEDDQNRLYSVLESHLRRHDELRTGRHLSVPISTITVLPTDPPVRDWSEENIFTGIDQIADVVTQLPSCDPAVYEISKSAIDRLLNIKPKNLRPNTKRSDSKGAILNEIERQLAVLDNFQRRAALETPAGPQQIRGLAGSGKTIVLALKAAYLHTTNPEWNIAVTFYSRSLYQQFKDLVLRFTFEATLTEPDEEKLKLLHSWGGRTAEGVYSYLCDHLSVPPLDFATARRRHPGSPLGGACAELLEYAKSIEADPVFDAVLIDEAQDLPEQFLRLLFYFTKPPKRIIFAYDELQSLSDISPASIDETLEDIVDFSTTYEHAQADITLPTVYRNTPWSLSLAHSLGLGLKRDDGLVQHFDDPAVWEEVGYTVVSGDLQLGHDVVLARREDSYPRYFHELLTPDSIEIKSFDDPAAQAEWVASRIQNDLDQEELRHQDLLVVLPSAYTSKTDAGILMEALRKRNISSHLVGVSTDPSRVFVDSSVAITHIFRAKGNEAAAVYVMNGNEFYEGANLIARRNRLFTALTRSKAWLTITGVGSNMQRLAAEAQATISKNYQLEFKIPSHDQLQELRRIHSDRSRSAADRVKEATEGLERFIELYRSGSLDPRNLPPEVLMELRDLDFDRFIDEP